MNEEITFEDYAEDFKNLPFSKSWENAYVSKTHRILDTVSGITEERKLEDFLYIPAASLLSYYGSDREFLRFRNEHQYDEDWDYKLLENKNDNNNRRMAVFYVSRILDALDIKFMVDNSYGIFIEIDELAQRARDTKPDKEQLYKSIYTHFSVPKAINTRVGATESWGN